MRPWSEALSLACRLFLGGLYLWAAHDKVWLPAEFAAAMAEYDMLPLWAVNPASVALAWLELVLGLLLLLGVWLRAAAAWAAALLALFTGLMVWAGFTGAGFDCGCFPAGAGHPAGFESALRDFLMMLPALWLLWRPGRWLALRPQ
ncbi:MAG: DoxX family membrane protein [Desulfarculus sp.]|nr:MAG: DoxX family membrane protein [Desulfarculus sp.]